MAMMIDRGAVKSATKAVEVWLQRNGVGASDDSFRAGYMAWRSLQTIEQRGYEQSSVLRELTERNVRAFAAMIAA